MLCIPECVQEVEKFVQVQEPQIELAVTGEGKYQFRSQYKHLKKTKEQWIKMSPDERQRHLNRVSSQKVNAPVVDGAKSVNNQRRQTASKERIYLFITVEESRLLDYISLFALRNMWEKASYLLNEEGSISKPLGKFYSDENARQSQRVQPTLAPFCLPAQNGKSELRQLRFI